MVASFLQRRLLQHAIERTWRNIVARFAGNGNAPRFGWMLELPVTSACDGQIPAVFVNEAQQFTDFHAVRIPAFASASKRGAGALVTIWHVPRRSKENENRTEQVGKKCWWTRTPPYHRPERRMDWA